MPQKTEIPDEPTRQALLAAIRETGALWRVVRITRITRRTLAKVRDGKPVLRATLADLRERLGVYGGAK